MKTRNNLKSNAKKVSIEILNARLADGIDLALSPSRPIGTSRGRISSRCTEMIDGFRGELDTHVNTMAERVVQLGGTALGTTQTVAAATRLAPYPTDIHSSKDHLGALAERYGTAAESGARGDRPDRRSRRRRHRGHLHHVFPLARQGALVPRSASSGARVMPFPPQF